MKYVMNLCLILTVIFLFPLMVESQGNDHLFEEEDCDSAYGCYADGEGEGICDRSQLPPQERNLSSKRIYRYSEKKRKTQGLTPAKPQRTPAKT